MRIKKISILEDFYHYLNFNSNVKFLFPSKLADDKILPWREVYPPLQRLRKN